MQLPPGQTFSYPYTSAQLPFVYNSGYLPLPGMPVAVADATTIKSENSLVQSRGTSPMAVSGTPAPPSPGEDTKPIVSSPNSIQCDSARHGEENVKDNDASSIEAKNSEFERTESSTHCTPEDETCRVSSCKQETSDNCRSVDDDCQASVDVERILEDTELKREFESEHDDPSLECPSNGVAYPENSDEETENKSDRDSITKISETDEVSENVNDEHISNENKDDETDRGVIVEETSEKSVESCSFQNNYNPYTDPLILQAADGLELLSALAEQRTKCPNVENQVSNELEQNTNIAKEKEKEKEKEVDKPPEKAKTVKVKRRRTNSEKSQISLHKKENKENKLTESFMTVSGDRIPLGRFMIRKNVRTVFSELLLTDKKN